MSAYIDAFVLAVKEDRLEEYRKIEEDMAQIWLDHGALSYHEYLSDDIAPGKQTSFPQSVLLEDGEVVIFAWITYPSKEVRDDVNKKVMEDPRITNMNTKNMPFDGARVIYGGFKSFLTKSAS